MISSAAPQSKIQVDMGHIRAGGILMGVGGAFVLAGATVAGRALMAAFRRRVQQMDVPPSDLARQHWSAVKHATSAGVDVWLKEQPAGQHQTAGHR
ncbi:MAG: hypothetical protein ABSA02_14340 [Trebonia sp.]|jgi:hypothetical protein